MRQEQIIMGMPVIVEIADKESRQELFDEVFDYLKYIDEKFSTYKETSEISEINKGKIKFEEASEDMKTVFRLSEETKNLTNGYFDIRTPDKDYDPSGLVKGWSIWKAGEILRQRGVKNFFVEVGGDIQTFGTSENGSPWSIGIQNPFSKKREVVKKVCLGKGEGIATSGSYIRGAHIYNPKDKTDDLGEVASITVVGPNIFEADRYATAAFAMGNEGIFFIENLPGFEGYSIDKHGIATMTSGFANYTINNKKTHA